METYLIAMIKFFFKPRNRLWDPEGTISLVQITAPKVTEGPQIKDFGGNEASQRLAYLAQVVDTKGWATRGATSASDNLSDIFVAEASHAEDMLDSSSGVAQSIDQRIAQTADARLSAVRQQFQTAIQQQPAPQVQPATPVDQAVQPAPVAADPQATPHYDPYPEAMHQHVLSPAGTAPQTAPANPPQAQAEKQPGSETVSPDIMRLANNNDLSISALAHEAHRLEDDDKEVIISLR